MDIALGEKIKCWDWWFKWFIKFCGRVGILPYSWDGKRGLVKLTTSKIQLYCWYIGTICLVCDDIYLIVTAVTTNYSQISYDITLKFLVHTISRIGACVACVTTFYKLHLSKDFVNHALSLHRRYKYEQLGDADARVKEGITGLFWFGTVLTVIHPVIGPLVQFLQERDSMRYWGSRFLPGHIYNSTLGIVIFSAIELLLSYISLAGACYVMAVLSAYCGVVNFWLKRLSDVNIKMKLYKKVAMYRTLQVLDGLHNTCCGDIWWPLSQNMYLYLHVLINVILIKCNSIIPASYLIMLAFASMILTVFERNCMKFASQLYDYSLLVRQNMVNRMNGKSNSRAIGRSLRCLRAQVSSFYFLKMSTFTCYLQALVDQTINVILTFLS